MPRSCVRRSPAMDRLHLLDLAEEPLCAIVPETHEIAGLPEVSAARLAEEPWLEARVVTDPVFAEFWYFRDRREDAAVRAHRGRNRGGVARRDRLRPRRQRGAGGARRRVPTARARVRARLGRSSDAARFAWRKDDSPPAAIRLAEFVRAASRSRRWDAAPLGSLHDGTCRARPGPGRRLRGAVRPAHRPPRPRGPGLLRDRPAPHAGGGDARQEPEGADPLRRALVGVRRGRAVRRPGDLHVRDARSSACATASS